MISSSRPRACIAADDAPKPRVKMIAGGNKTLQADKAAKKTDKSSKDKKQKKKKKAKDESSNSDDSPNCSDPMMLQSGDNAMSQLHASHGSLGGSFASLGGSQSTLNYDDFQTPNQQSPFKAKLRKAPDHVKNISAPTLSPVHLKPIKERPTEASKAKNYDYLDPNHNSLLEEFSTPKQSPWQRKVSMKATSGAPVFRDEDFSTTNNSESQSQSHLNSTTETILSKEQKAEVKKLKKEKKAKKKASTSTPDPAVPTSTKKKKNKSAESGAPSILKSPIRSKGVVPTGKKSKKKAVKFAPSSRVYGMEHAKAASRIAALVRGKRARLVAKVRRLEYRLGNQEALQEWQLKQIKKETKAKKKEFEQRAKERFQKNLERKGAPDAMIDDAHNIVATIRKENADVRARNQRLMKDIENLKINNARLEASNESGDEFYDRLKYHDDTCIAENIKLTKIAGSYKTAVDEHKEHLEMHIAYGEAEHKIKSIYSKLLKDILGMMDGCSNKELAADIHAIAENLEQEHGSSKK